MKRIMIIGNAGSGKSTFSKQLGGKLSIPVIHLDKYFHKPNWTKPKPGEWDAIQKKITKKNSWIIDGTYHRTLPLRAASADTIIYLKVPRWLSFIRILKRRVMYRKKHRDDLPDYLNDRLSLQLMYKILIFSEKRMLMKLKDNKDKIITLKNKDQVKEYLNNV